MNKEWITSSEASFLTGKSEVTIRRFVSEHKSNTSNIKKVKGKTHIKKLFLEDYYPLINDDHASINEDVKHKKEAMQLAYNSEAIQAQIEQLKAKDEQLKAKDEHIKDKDKQIEQLINKKSCAWLWLSIGFIILIIVLSVIVQVIFTGYKSELLDNHKAKITDIAANNKAKTTYLTSNHQKEVNLLRDQLTDTKKSYSDLIKEIKESSNKLSENQQQTIKEKEAAISRLQSELDKLNKNINTDTEI